MKKTIVGMSMKRKDLGAYIDNHTFQVMVALAQLYLFPQGPRVHWRKEVWEKFHRIYKLKKTNDLPSAQFIYDNSWNLNIHNLKNAYQFAIDTEDEYEPKLHANMDEYHHIVEDYFLWLADKLSQTETVLLSEVKEELDSLGLDEAIDWS